MKQKKVTFADIAAYTGFSKTTISRYFNNPDSLTLENQEKIFDPFYRVDKSRSRAMGGAGLGLALVSEIARQHNGQVKVTQSSEKGSTIALILPKSTDY